MIDEAEQVQDESGDEEVKVVETETTETEEVEENEIVLASEPDQSEQVKPSDPKSHILKRFAKQKDKLQTENEALKKSLEEIAARTGTVEIEAEPDEYSFDNRGDYLKAKAEHSRKMMQGVAADQLHQERSGHRVVAAEQAHEKALHTYAESAVKLKVSDFNDTQDKACDVLGDEFSQLIVQTLPDEAPKLLYWFGKNPSDAAKYRDDYLVNPGSTTFNLGKLAGQLTIKSKRSTAADPESKVVGGNAAGGNVDWKAKLDKIDDSATPDNIAKTLNARRALKREAKAAGVTL